QIIEDAPQPPRQLVPHLPAELERVCLKALARRVEDRYTTARDFAEELRRSVSGNAAVPARVQPPAPARGPGESERRRLTLLVCGCESPEVAGSLDLLDAEDQHAIQQAFHQFCADVA